LAAARAVPSNLSQTVFMSCVHAANNNQSSEGKFHSLVAFPTIIVVFEDACVKAKKLTRSDTKEGVCVQPKFEQRTVEMDEADAEAEGNLQPT